MADQDHQYSIYGSTTGGDPNLQSPIEGPMQAKELLDKMELKPRLLGILRNLGLRYPIKSRADFLGAIKRDVPGACQIPDRPLSLKDMVSLLRDSDFPLNSDLEAASRLAEACPISAVSAE